MARIPGYSEWDLARYELDEMPTPHASEDPNYDLDYEMTTDDVPPAPPEVEEALLASQAVARIETIGRQMEGLSAERERLQELLDHFAPTDITRTFDL